MRRQLHWLPIRQRYVFKLATVTYKARLSGLPAYLQCEIHDYHPSRTLRSTSALLLRSSNQPLVCIICSESVLCSRSYTGLKLNCLNLALVTVFGAIAALQIRLRIDMYFALQFFCIVLYLYSFTFSFLAPKIISIGLWRYRTFDEIVRSRQDRGRSMTLTRVSCHCSLS